MWPELENIGLWKDRTKEASHQGHVLCDSIYVQCPEWANPWDRLQGGGYSVLGQEGQATRRHRVGKAKEPLRTEPLALRWVILSV